MILMVPRACWTAAISSQFPHNKHALAVMSAGDNRAQVRTVAIRANMPNELLVVHVERWIMAARKWTDEQKARQAALIHGWQPWKRSTGARTPEGKATSSLNACRGYWRRRVRFAHWLLWAKYHTTHLTPELISEAKRRAEKLRVFD